MSKQPVDQLVYSPLLCGSSNLVTDEGAGCFHGLASTSAAITSAWFPTKLRLKGITKFGRYLGPTAIGAGPRGEADGEHVHKLTQHETGSRVSPAGWFEHHGGIRTAAGRLLIAAMRSLSWVKSMHVYVPMALVFVGCGGTAINGNDFHVHVWANWVPMLVRNGSSAVVPRSSRRQSRECGEPGESGYM